MATYLYDYRTARHTEIHAWRIIASCFSPDDRCIAVSFHGIGIVLYDLHGNQLSADMIVPTVYPQSLCLSNNGKKLAVFAGDDSNSIWDLQNGSMIIKRCGFGNNQHSVCAFSPNGEFIIYDGFEMEYVFGGNSCKNRPVCENDYFNRNTPKCPNGLWNIKENMITNITTGEDYHVMAAFSDDGKYGLLLHSISTGCDKNKRCFVSRSALIYDMTKKRTIGLSGKKPIKESGEKPSLRFPLEGGRNHQEPDGQYRLILDEDATYLYRDMDNKPIAVFKPHMDFRHGEGYLSPRPSFPPHRP